MNESVLELDYFKYKNVNELLNEILRKLENINRFNDSLPKCLRLTFNQYYDIKGYNPSLIKKVDDEGYFILGMKVVF